MQWGRTGPGLPSRWPASQVHPPSLSVEGLSPGRVESTVLLGTRALTPELSDGTLTRSQRGRQYSPVHSMDTRGTTDRDG